MIQPNIQSLIQPEAAKGSFFSFLKHDVVEGLRIFLQHRLSMNRGFFCLPEDGQAFPLFLPYKEPLPLYKARQPAESALPHEVSYFVCKGDKIKLFFTYMTDIHFIARKYIK